MKEVIETEETKEKSKKPRGEIIGVMGAPIKLKDTGLEELQGIMKTLEPLSQRQRINVLAAAFALVGYPVKP